MARIYREILKKHLIQPNAPNQIGDMYYCYDAAGEFKNIDSKILLKETVALVRSKGYEIGNIDATICAERPKLKDYIEPMQNCLAGVMGIDSEDVSIKATTTEKLGFVGRKEGIAAYATQDLPIIHVQPATRVLPRRG